MTYLPKRWVRYFCNYGDRSIGIGLQCREIFWKAGLALSIGCGAPQAGVCGMRRHILLAIAALGLALWGAPARADGPWYVSASIGGYFREQQSGTEDFFRLADPEDVHPGTLQQSFSPGLVGNVAIGYALPARFRVEAELGYAAYQLDSVNPSSSFFPNLNGSTFKHQSGGDYSRFMGTLNLFYDLPFGKTFVPYVGAGLGGAHAESTTGKFVSANGTIFENFGGQTTRGVTLVEGGVTIALTNALSLVPAYRYLHFFGGAGFGAGEAAHVVKLGLRYAF
jgi:opacity protein-like surface antigen